MDAEHSRRLTPIGLSVLVNLALIRLMARALVTAPAEGQRYIAVELRTAPTFNVQHSPAFSGIPPKAGNAQRPKSVQRSSFRVQRSVPDVRRSTLDVRSSTFEVGRSPFTVHGSLSLPMPGPIEVASSLQNFAGAGTSATGPGAYVGVGPGGGTSGPGESTISMPQAGTTPNVQLPTSNFQPPVRRLKGKAEVPRWQGRRSRPTRKMPGKRGSRGFRSLWQALILKVRSQA